MRNVIPLMFLVTTACTTIPVSAMSCDITAKDIPCVEYVSAHDGDTLTIRISEEQVPEIFAQWQIRVRGVDTPEMLGDTDCEREYALKAKKFTIEHLSAAKRIDLLNVAADKYFRLLADVEIDGQSLAEELIASGWGVPYDGGTKVPFKCPKHREKL